MNQFPVDVDAEAIFLDNAWYTRDDLARRIKMMIDQGDFAISRPSAALEELNRTMQSVRTLMFRVTPDLADALNQLATRSDKTVGQLLRDAVNHLLMTPVSLPPPVPTPPHHDPAHHEAPANAPVPEPRVTAPTPALVSLAAPAPSAPIAALRAAGIARDSEPTVEVSASEGRWFKQ
jgi:hypothetical protein